MAPTISQTNPFYVPQPPPDAIPLLTWQTEIASSISASVLATEDIPPHAGRQARMLPTRGLYRKSPYSTMPLIIKQDHHVRFTQSVRTTGETTRLREGTPHPRSSTGSARTYTRENTPSTRENTPSTRESSPRSREGTPSNPRSRGNTPVPSSRAGTRERTPSRSTRTVSRERTPSSNLPEDRDSDSESDLTVLSDDGGDVTSTPIDHIAKLNLKSLLGDDEGKIPKPQGEVGRPGRGGYNLEETLSWSKQEYDELQTLAKTLAAKHLDRKLSVSKQKDASMLAVVTAGLAAILRLQMYAQCWPLTDALRMHLKYTSSRARSGGKASGSSSSRGASVQPPAPRRSRSTSKRSSSVARE
ncbi:hypothetical protein EUX98_g8745 [Antrodiella citrinella]|uniref:Uncharacterized protein n=1 Tax=Antrodiella citrinella TaxID=2447956 RepID=A0A4S4M3A2_9APHY|nr:hypothetical protein EUX98_g8745 [Antrodiella citrinella]